MTEVRLLRDGSVPTPPDFEQLSVERDYKTTAITNSNVAEYTGLIENVDNQKIHEALWVPYFTEYFPEAKNQWEMMEAVPSDSSLSEDQKEKKESYNQYVSNEILFYKQSFEEHLQVFKQFLYDEENIMYKKAFEGSVRIDKNGIPEEQNASPRLEEDEINENRLVLWKAFLKKHTDILIRARTVYIWVIIDMMDLIESIQEAALNAANTVRRFNKTQKNIVKEMGELQFKKMGKYPFPLDIPKWQPVSQNGESNYKMQILKAYQTKAQELGNEKNAERDAAFSAYGKQNSFIVELLSQVEGIINEMF